MLQITPLAVFNDNYIWVITRENTSACIVVDPGDATAVCQYLQRHQKYLAAVLITHHHRDHTGGLAQLKQMYPEAEIIGPRDEADKIEHLTHWVADGDHLSFDALNWTCKVIDLRGHTAGHIGFYSAPVLFCGDTLFSVGCGRIFEGSPSQLFQAIQRICALPDDTQVYCTHEYTLANIAFALTVEPENQKLKQYLALCQQKRQLSEPTLPVRLGLEKDINPFLRCENSDLKVRYEKNSALELFSFLRQSKDQFKS